MMFRKRKRIGLALGGGGARGLAHIGVLKVLDSEKIPIDLVVGTSMGALVGGAYASGISPDELKKRVDAYLNSTAFQSSAMKAFETAHAKGELGLTQKIQTYLRNCFYLIQAMFKPGLLSNEDFQATINYFIPDIQIEETRIPFRAAATDRCISCEELRNVVDVYYRVSEIMGEKLKNYELAEADVAILPEVGDLHWSNFSQAMTLIDEGEKAAWGKLDDIRNVMPGIKKWFRFKKIPKRKTKKVSP